MFYNFQQATIDEKGRIKLPKRHYKQIIDGKHEGQFMLTLHPSEQCLVLYPFNNWLKVAEKVSALPSMHRLSKGIKRRVLAYANDCHLDSAGRFLVPKTLRDEVPMTKDIYISGQGSGFEIWSSVAWDKQKIDAKELQNYTDLPAELQGVSL